MSDETLREQVARIVGRATCIAVGVDPAEIDEHGLESFDYEAADTIMALIERSAEDTRRLSEVHAVCLSDYDSHSVAGVFRDASRARAYAEELRDFADGDRDVSIETYAVDPPRDTLAGEWEILVDASGNEIERNRQSWGPVNWDGFKGHVWNDNRIADDGSAARGVGLTPEEALGHARAALSRAAIQANDGKVG